MLFIYLLSDSFFALNSSLSEFYRTGPFVSRYPLCCTIPITLSAGNQTTKSSLCRFDFRITVQMYINILTFTIFILIYFVNINYCKVK